LSLEWVRFTVLVENNAGRRDLLGEHGLAVLVETPSAKVLFDTGQGRALSPNAKALGCSLADIDSILLSHGHYDHTGGLGAVLAEAPQARLFAHPMALEPKYSSSGSGSRYIGVSPENLQKAQARGPLLRLTAEPVVIAEGLTLTGRIERRRPFEKPSGRFFLDESCRRIDLMEDDQALVIDGPTGLLVLLGCAHAGVVNTLEAVAELAGVQSLAGVFGGMHLAGCGAERLSATMDEFDRFGLRHIAPGHCTGTMETAEMLARFGRRAAPFHAGTVVEFTRPPAKEEFVEKLKTIREPGSGLT